MSLQLILFDIDGTLLDAKGIGRVSTRRALLEMFGTTGRLETHHFAGKTDRGTLCELLDMDDTEAGRHMPAFEACLARHMRELLPGYGPVALPGALETVQQLRKRGDCLTGIVTGNTAATTPLKLDAAGFDPAWFPVRACGSEASDRNVLPALAMERARAHSGRAITAQQVTVVGDTPADVACARAVGARSVAVSTGFSSREELLAAGPDYLLDGLDGILSLCEA